MDVKLTLTEKMLGTASGNPEIHRDYIAAKGPKPEEEVDAIPQQEIEKTMTVFPRTESGQPFVWDYQIKGFLKDACSMLRRVPDSMTAKECTKKGGALKAYKKVIDGLIFVEPRKIVPVLPEGGRVEEYERPLRGQTAQGERIALAHSETIPAGTTLAVTIRLLNTALEPVVCEWLNYGALRGLGQWRNAGWGRFVWTER